MPVPRVGLILYLRFSPFRFSVPYLVFDAVLSGQALFDLSIVAPSGGSVDAERTMTVRADGARAGPRARPLTRAGCPCGGALLWCLLAYAGMLEGRRASTRWLAEQDFSERFPGVRLDANALYVEDDRLVASAGTGAGLDCCLYIVREYHGAQIANRLARMMVIPPHREGGQAQFIEQPVAASTQDAHINRLLDYLRQNLSEHHGIDDLAARTAMSRRTFTRHFRKATGMTVVEWLVDQRLRRSRELLATTSLPVERIAERVGFQTAMSFRQHFRRIHRVSPSAWRRTFRDDDPSSGTAPS